MATASTWWSPACRGRGGAGRGAGVFENVLASCTTPRFADSHLRPPRGCGNIEGNASKTAHVKRFWAGSRTRRRLTTMRRLRWYALCRQAAAAPPSAWRGVRGCFGLRPCSGATPLPVPVGRAGQAAAADAQRRRWQQQPPRRFLASVASGGGGGRPGAATAGQKSAKKCKKTPAKPRPPARAHTIRSIASSEWFAAFHTASHARMPVYILGLDVNTKTTGYAVISGRTGQLQVAGRFDTTACTDEVYPHARLHGPCLCISFLRPVRGISAFVGAWCAACGCFSLSVCARRPCSCPVPVPTARPALQATCYPMQRDANSAPHLPLVVD